MFTRFLGVLVFTSTLVLPGVALAGHHSQSRHRVQGNGGAHEKGYRSQSSTRYSTRGRGRRAQVSYRGRQEHSRGYDSHHGRRSRQGSHHGRHEPDRGLWGFLHLVHHVEHVVQGHHRRRYDCGCRLEWQEGYWDYREVRRGRHWIEEEVWVSGRWSSLGTCDRHGRGGRSSRRSSRRSCGY